MSHWNTRCSLALVATSAAAVAAFLILTSAPAALPPFHPPLDHQSIAATEAGFGDQRVELARYLSGGPGSATAWTVRRYSRAIAPPLLVAAQGGPEAPAPRTYLGQNVCSACHQLEAQNWAHTIHAKVFNLNPGNALEERGCEACHGPGSAHIQNPREPLSIIRFSSRSQTPIPVQNAQCLTCHRGGQRIFWPGSVHETNDTACSDCHNPHSNFSARGLTARQSVNETCFQCHAEQRAEFRRRSHKPVLEGQLSCSDCHNPHGSATSGLLKTSTVNETCYGCHADKRGPLLFEHAPVRDSCLNCHMPHGSNHEKLLVSPGPLLCQQCHTQPGHDTLLMTRGNMASGPFPDPRLIGRNCTVCHAQVHGSNSPAGPRLLR